MILNQRLYVEMDALHDTRYGLVLHKWPWMLSSFDYTKYQERIVDTWIAKIGISEADWKEAWESRDAEVLKQTPPTALLYELIRELEMKYKANELGSPVSRPELTINTYPYIFSAAESISYMSIAKELYGQLTTNIELVCLKPEVLTPEYLKENFESGFIYNWRQWLEIHISALSKNPMPGFVLNGPALLDINSVSEVAGQVVEDKVNPFTEAKDFLSEFLTLDLYSAGLFSLRLPEKSHS